MGIDLGILTFAHDSDGTAVRPLDEQADRARIEKRHRALSRKQHGSSNWEKARVKLAEAYERLTNKRTDFIEKLSHSYTIQYDAVFLEELKVRGMLSQDSNGRNIASMLPSEARLLTRSLRILVMAWRETISTFKRHGDKHGCHVITIPPEGTTKRCAKCDAESRKALWIREHSCPACGFECDRDENAAYNVQKRGLDELDIDYEVEDLLGLGETEDTCPKIEDFWHPENASRFRQTCGDCAPYGCGRERPVVVPDCTCKARSPESSVLAGCQT